MSSANEYTASADPMPVLSVAAGVPARCHDIADKLCHDIADRSSVRTMKEGWVQGGGLPPPALYWEGVVEEL